MTPRLRNMCPAFSQNDVTDRGWINSEFFRDAFLSSAIFKSRSDEFNFRVIEFCARIFSSAFIALTVLGNHIARVVRFRAEPQMQRIHAGRIVTFVKHAKSLRDWAEVINPGKPVRENRVTVCGCELSISFASEACRPNPARAKLWSVWRNRAASVHLFQETFLNGFEVLTVRVYVVLLDGFCFGGKTYDRFAHNVCVIVNRFSDAWAATTAPHRDSTVSARLGNTK
jgi:hypothetical protein